MIPLSKLISLLGRRWSYSENVGLYAPYRELNAHSLTQMLRNASLQMYDET